MVWIKFGDCNKYYKYIVFSCTFNYLTYHITTGNLNNILISLFDSLANSENLYYHNIIYDIFNYLGIIIISLILYKIKENRSSTNKPSNENDNEINVSEIQLIHNDIKDEINKDISLLNLLFILSYWIFIDHMTKIIQSLMIFDYWMFELLMITFIASIRYKIRIYTHQIIGITINSLCCFAFGIIRFYILFFNFYDKGFPNEEIPLFSIKYAWFIPISIIIYFYIISSTSFIFAKLKFYMDLKFISQVKLLILYGIIGFVFSSIACTIETFFKCVGNEKEFFCKIYIPYKENETNVTNTTITNDRINKNDIKKDLYIENIFIFFYIFQTIKKVGAKIIEIALILIRVLFNFCSLYFDMLVIKNLTPMHFMFGSFIYIFLTNLTEIIIIKINKKEVDDYQSKIDLLNVLAYFCTFIGFMIYLEIIELNFCKLNYNLRKYIYIRSIKDTYDDDASDSIISDNDSYEKNPSIRNSINSIELQINKQNSLLSK